jgi:diguanylate cyclase (GGDEF)-like protein
LRYAEERKLKREREPLTPAGADVSARGGVRITPEMFHHFRSLVNLSEELQLPQTLEEMLQRVVDRAAILLGTGYASIRLLDATRTRLLIGCRAGAPLHRNASFEFKVGEGLVGCVALERQAIRLADCQDDPRFLARADLTIPFHSFLGVPLVFEGDCIGVLSIVHPDRDSFDLEDEQLLLLLAGMCAPHLEIARMARLVRVDPISGTLTRAGLDDAFSESPPTHAGQAAGPVSVLVVDIDSFRVLNEKFGREVGDAVLRSVGQILAGTLRVGDAVVRYGADEFLLVVPGVALTSASRIAERARAAIERTAIDAAGFVVQTSVTIGVAQRKGNEPRELLVKRAEAALVSAKRRGHNQVQLAME